MTFSVIEAIDYFCYYALGLPLLTQIKRNILLCDHLIKIELTMRTLDDKEGESILFVISLASRFFLIGRSVMVLMLKFRNDNRNTKQTAHFLNFKTRHKISI